MQLASQSSPAARSTQIPPRAARLKALGHEFTKRTHLGALTRSKRNHLPPGHPKPNQTNPRTAHCRSRFPEIAPRGISSASTVKLPNEPIKSFILKHVTLRRRTQRTQPTQRSHCVSPIIFGTAPRDLG